MGAGGGLRSPLATLVIGAILEKKKLFLFSKMFGLLFHHSEFANALDAHLDNDILQRVHLCAVRIELDDVQDTKFPWLFRGLSVQRVNQIMHVLSRMRQLSYYDSDEDELKRLVTPYDAMPFKTNTEDDLFVSYSIKDVTDPFRQLILGPHSVSLYEPDIPHFGPIYVFRARVEERSSEESLVYRMMEIQSGPEEILSALQRLNFGGL